MLGKIGKGRGCQWKFKKKLLFSLACSYRKGEENAAITVNDEDGNE